MYKDTKKIDDGMITDTKLSPMRYNNPDENNYLA